MSFFPGDILKRDVYPQYIYPFTPLRDSDSYEDIENRILELKSVGLASMTLLWGSKNGSLFSISKFNCPEYWERLAWVVEICKKRGMTFRIQDAAPFPTGQADGAFDEMENLSLNKLYLRERHMDIAGPNPGGCFAVARLMRALQLSDLKDPARLPGDNMLCVIAVRRNQESFDISTAVDLTDSVRDNLLFWPVPEGIWRLFVIFESHNGGGRKRYMNLLDRDSVALNIERVHRPHYEFLKGEINKTWLGFFYDEPEIGNVPGYDLNVMVGGSSASGESMAMPWCAQLPSRLEAKLGGDYRKLLPLLWYGDGASCKRLRYCYMDEVTRLISENYNGQTHQWCAERGIGYLGHALEDENSHCRLGCGPGHYFRMQKHQDAAGIDIVGNQLMPGKDFTQAWYGCRDGDGAFYHYCLAKLSSSAARIDPRKRGRSFCEAFALYGALAGTRLCKFVYDHLLVNGVSEFVPASGIPEGLDAQSARTLYSYVMKMSKLLHETNDRLPVALIYHGEGEWFSGDYELCQTAAKALAENQIGYDIIPSDVFEDTAYYRTAASEGLSVNGNKYEALVIPGCEALPGAVAEFVKNAALPVFVLGNMPDRVADTCEPASFPNAVSVAEGTIADLVGRVIARDIEFDGDFPSLRCSCRESECGRWWLIHNQGDRTRFKARLNCDGAVYKADAINGRMCEIHCEATSFGRSIQMEIDKYEMLLLYSGNVDIKPEALAPRIAQQLTASWEASIEDGRTFAMDAPANINRVEYAPGYCGRIAYRCKARLDRRPVAIDLGDVYERCRVFINGVDVGGAIFSPYLIFAGEAFVVGDNEIVIEVIPNRAAECMNEEMPLTASVYNALDPSGILGPVRLIY